MSAHDLVERIEHCRQTGRGKWLARCPAHQDKTPSLSITEKDDGRVLINCHAGCSPLDVITAVGLEWDALFPEGDNFKAERRQHHIAVDELVVEIARADRKAGRKQSPADKEREAEAYARLLRRGNN